MSKSVTWSILVAADRPGRSGHRLRWCIRADEEPAAPEAAEATKAPEAAEPTEEPEA